MEPASVYTEAGGVVEACIVAAMLALAAYNALVGLTLRDGAHDAYVAYAFSSAAVYTTYFTFPWLPFEGLGWPPETVRSALNHVASALGLAMALVFTERFLALSERVPPAGRLFGGAALALLFGTPVLVLLLPASTTEAVLGVAGGLAIAAALSAGLHELAAGQRAARFFVLAWLPLAVAGALFAPVAIGLTEAPLVSGRTLAAAHFLEMLLLAFALTDRLRWATERDLLRQRALLGDLRVELAQKGDVGEYRLGALLGAGGMGRVYRATHRLLERDAAVKLLPPQRFGPEATRAFAKEARLTSRLRHPNVVQVYECGFLEHGVFYYAMELIGGASLATIVRRTGALSAARVVAILDQVASALEAAHAERIVHRDVKPSNVLLQRDARFEETVKVVDFGVAKAPGAYRRDPGAGFAGTPLYMAPEAVSEAFERVSPAADIYALGALGFYLLTARHAFHGRTRMETRVRHARGPRPSARRRRPDVCSPELDALLVAMMDLSPDARPDASAVRARLAACPEAGAWTDADERAWWASEGADVAHAPSDSEALTHTVFPDLTDPAAVTQDLRTGPRAAADTPT